MKRTYVAFVLDDSGSMSMFRQQAVDTVNSLMQTVIKGSAEDGQPTTIATVLFNNNARVISGPLPAEKASLVAINQYIPNGGTAMFDGVKLAIDTLVEAHKADKRAKKKAIEANFLIVTITDGEENASMFVNARQLSTQIKELEGEDNWTFAFNVPRGYGTNLQRMLGLALDNIREWEQTTKGLAETMSVNNQSLRNFVSASANGQGSTKTFYAKVTTDASAITAKTVKRELNDVTTSFKLLNVADENTIKPFFEAKMKRAYQIGAAFYMLMKKEKIQPQKEILLLRRSDGRIFGGQGARDLIGLPEGDYANVTPGNHGEYDIFVQSTSTNRILPRGTKVLAKL